MTSTWRSVHAMRGYAWRLVSEQVMRAEAESNWTMFGAVRKQVLCRRHMTGALVNDLRQTCDISSVCADIIIRADGQQVTVLSCEYI